VKWAEKGEAPASITALASPPALNPGRTRPLCPYPQTAIYNGTGSTLLASSRARNSKSNSNQYEIPGGLGGGRPQAFRNNSRSGSF